MALKLSEVNLDHEFNELIECEWISYESPYNGFFQIYCPTVGPGPNPRQASMKESTERQLAWHKDDPTSTWLKVVDKESGKVVGGAQWNVYLENPYPDGVEHTDAFWWPEGEGRKYASMALEQWYTPRGKRMNKPHILLNICFVHPAHRRRGVGSLLVSWGVQRADELDLEVFIEAVEPGVPLYLKHGFRVIDQHWVDPKVPNPSEEWIQLKEKIPPIPWTFMWRPRKGTYTKLPWEDDEEADGPDYNKT
ncbi:MAG: hypothetical protein Q9188_003170 [Gyalolechia gomerana]